MEKFKFENYSLNYENFIANFDYSIGDIRFTESIQFIPPQGNSLSEEKKELIDRSLFLAFILIGTSYYKTHPSHDIYLDFKIDEFQADFFNHVYQEGLSQFAFENNFTRDDLAHFKANSSQEILPIRYFGDGIISLQSGGKDSLLTSELLLEKDLEFSPLYISNSDYYPKILDSFSSPLLCIKRTIDIENIKKASGFNGHVPITYINQAIALLQAIILDKNMILTSIGQEGNEPHAMIGDLKVNHQWSKTWEAEQLFAEYVKRYLSSDIKVGSPLRKFSELKIAQLFVEKCWDKYGHTFSSCNIANYNQGAENSNLKWCAKCAKCANSFLLFAPFLPINELRTIFNNKDLFNDEDLTETFKGLLGIDGRMKPFECVGEIDELRKAYHMKQTGYTNLPFHVPESDFDYEKIFENQSLI